jgi:hypothetical protein
MTEVAVETGYTLIGGGARVNWSDPGNLMTACYPIFDQNRWVAASTRHRRRSDATITAYAIGVQSSGDHRFK